jgi:hypothetical protein
VTEPPTLILWLSFSIVTCDFFPIGISCLLSKGFGTGNFPSKGFVGFVEDVSLLGFVVIAGLVVLGINGLVVLGVIGLVVLCIIGLVVLGIIGLVVLGIIGLVVLGVIGLVVLGVIGLVVLGIIGLVDFGTNVGV